MQKLESGVYPLELHTASLPDLVLFPMRMMEWGEISKEKTGQEVGFYAFVFAAAEQSQESLWFSWQR